MPVKKPKPRSVHYDPRDLEAWFDKRKRDHAPRRSNTAGGNRRVVYRLHDIEVWLGQH